MILANVGQSMALCSIIVIGEVYGLDPQLQHTYLCQNFTRASCLLSCYGSPLCGC
jgi:hypothetical protein